MAMKGITLLGTALCKPLKMGMLLVFQDGQFDLWSGSWRMEVADCRLEL
jgi:hypothetical protein